MKKTTNSLLITALILFCAGLLLALSSSLYAKIADIEVFDVEKKAKTIESISVGLDEILSVSPESNFVKKLSQTEFSKVEIHSFVGDVKICTGAEKTELVLEKANTNNLSYSIIGDTLTIQEVDPVGFMGIYVDKGGFSFKGLRHMFHPGSAFNSGKTITLNLAEGLQLDQLDVSASVGDVDLDGVFAGTVNVESSFGDVTLKKLSNDAGKITVKGNFTDVELDQNQYANFSASTHFGNIDAHIIESTTQSTILDLWCGDIGVKTDLPTSFYKLSLSTSLGDIQRNEENVGKELSASGTSAARISSNIFMGDFDLQFSGEDEESFVPKNTAQTPAENPENSSVPETAPQG